MEFPCTFRLNTYLNNRTVYVCEFISQTIPENAQIIPIGTHLKKNSIKLDYKNNSHVVGVIFNECILTKVPQGLTKIFPNMRILSIDSSQLKVVAKADLAKYKNIERIGFCNNQIEYLPGDLFEGFKSLEEASFDGNNLQVIEPNILDGLDKLKNVSFQHNPAYTKYFSEFSGCEPNATLEEVKEELFLRYYKDYMKIDYLLKVDKENQAFKDTIVRLNQEINNFKGRNNQVTLKNNHKMNSQIRDFLRTDETFKDFRIQINDREFPVHKFLLAARSPTLAEILKNNPEVENLNLVDISAEIFEIILKFLYTDELPGEEGTDFLHLFAAAGKLKIEELKNHAAIMLIDEIENENAIDILRMSNKYEHNELRQCAYNKVKKENPKIKFQDDWSGDVDVIIEIINAFTMKEEAIKKAEEEFEKLILNKIKKL